MFNLGKKLLNLEIYDLHRRIECFEKQLRFLERSLSNLIPIYILRDIHDYFSISFDNCHRRSFYLHKKKFLNLLRERQIKSVKNIPPISYYCYNQFNSFKYETNQKHTDNINLITHVNLNPADFKHNNIDPIHILNDKWFLNLSEIDIPTEVSCLLQLGTNFGLPVDKKDYINKIEKTLQDKNIYQITEYNPINKIEKQLNGYLKNWLDKDLITRKGYLALLSSDSNLPRIYELSKIHKENTPYKIIVSSLNLNPIIYQRYVDDIIMTAPREHIDNILMVFNSFHKKNLVYKISCNKCDASYVRQTSKQLKTKVSEHKNDINRSKLTNSVLSEHKRCHNYNFNWNKVEILDNERNYNKRLIFEMINIKQQKNGINLNTDTELLVLVTIIF
ncbi:hypothetical protein ALC57_10422 [Trachymyrmex cornetzi]|uniref:Reverse transcriptase domain-containing protein n=1 Tax=Trachymyrmex cornetzi TaxID=471704 RepID=A0A195DWT7_9HYME|nr:hypothetical protein ALC57_10422 [Trachymyrmex cornetzi]